jgi:DNA-binding CsgD family transcriptional regulator
LEQTVSDLTEIMLLVGASEGRSPAAGVFLFHGRGWYPRVTALMGSAASTSVSLVVVSTDPEDPDLQRAEQLGLRSASRLDPGDPRMEAWRRWVANLPPATLAPPVLPVAPPPTAPPVLEQDRARALALLLGRGLTHREAEIALLAAKGLRNGEIARRLFLSEATIKGTMRRAYRKLGVVRRSGLLALLR